MNINQAVQSLANIICKNDAEKATVLNILHLNAKTPIVDDKGGLVISLHSTRYSIGYGYSRKYPLIAASDFITSNTPAE